MALINKFNTTSNCTLQMTFIGGPKALPPFEVRNPVRTGVVDVAATTGAFCTCVMPEANAFRLTKIAIGEL